MYKLSKNKMLSVLNRPLKTKSVPYRVLERIKESLIDGELSPGDFLPSEKELTEKLRVGKSSVREAVKMLQTMGVVDVIRGQGTIIRSSPGIDFVNSMIFQLILEKGTNTDIVDLRMLLEPAFTQIAMERATEEDIEAIKKTIDKFEGSVEKGIPKVEDDLDFHIAILRSTYNPYVIRIGETILQLFRSSISNSLKSTPESALMNHKHIFKAFCEKDPISLRNAIVESFNSWKQSFSDM